MGNFAATQTFITPFKYFLAKGIFTSGEINTLLDWFESGAKWKVHKTDFYEQYELNLSSDLVPTHVRQILNKDFISNIKSSVSELLGVKLQDKIQFVAHKLITNQGIGIHTDCPADETFETHRIIIYLNREFSDDFGGHLILFNSKNTSDIHRIIRPMNNSAFGFELSKKSFHAVTDIKNGERFSLNLSFWEKLPSLADYLEFDLFKTTNSKRALTFLIENNVHKSTHSNRRSIDHLIGVANLLTNWHCQETLILAGLFHNIYGTSVFNSIVIKINDREKVKRIIGSRAERLAYIYCTVQRKKLQSIFKEDIPIINIFEDNGEKIILNDVDILNLAILDIANSIEQIGFVKILDKNRLDITKEHLIKEFSLYSSLKKILPDNVFSSMIDTYQKFISG